MKIVKCPKCGSDIKLNESEPVAICEQCGAKFRNPIYVEPVAEEQIEPVAEEQIEPVVEEQIEPVVEEQVEPVYEEQIEPVMQQDNFIPVEDNIEPVQTDDMFAQEEFEPVYEPVKPAKPVKEKAPKPIKEKAPKESNGAPLSSSKKGLFIAIAVVAAVILIASLIISAIAVSQASPNLKMKSIADDLVDAGFTNVSYSAGKEYDEEIEGYIVGHMYAQYVDNFGSESYTVYVYLFDSKKSAEKYYDILNETIRNSSFGSYYGYRSSSKDVRIDGKVVYYGDEKAIDRI